MVLTTTRIGEGRELVMLPMYRFDSAAMAAAFEPMLTGVQGWQRIYIDLPGTGGSAPVAPNSDAVLEAVAETVISLRAPIPPLVVGVSYGGYLAMGLARRWQAQVTGMFLVVTGVRIAAQDRDLSGVGASRPENGWLDAVPTELHPHLEQAVGWQTAAVADRIVHALARRGPLDEPYLDELRATGYRLSDEKLEQIYDGDVMIVAGRQDRIAGYRDQFAALTRYPHGSYVAMDGAGHYLPLERPHALGALLRHWLGAKQNPG